jgi:hypothetical protein
LPTASPEVRIQPGRLLYRAISKRLYPTSFDKKKGIPFMSPEDLQKRTKEYIQAWEPKSRKILNGIRKSYGLNFEHNIIDVHIVPHFNPSMSHPLIIGTYEDPDEFVDSLAHELFHVLLSGNKENINLLQPTMDWFPEEGRMCQVHIPLHAGLQYLYLDVMKEPRRLKRNIKRHKQYVPAYGRAWEIVEQEGYKELISRFKSLYNITK